MSSDGIDRPLLTEMAERLRRARGTDFYGDVDGGARADGASPVAASAPPAAASARPPERAEPSEPRPSPDGLQGSTRIDSFERRLFELRVIVDELVSAQRGVPQAAPSRAPSDAEAWVAFAAAAIGDWDDAEAQARVADQLLVEYRARRSRGGTLGGE